MDNAVSKVEKSQVRGFHVLNIKATQEQMQDYFAYMAEQVKDHPCFFVQFGKHILKLTFPNAEYAEKYAVSLRYIKAESVEEPDGVIHIWNGKIRDYLPMKDNVNGDKWVYEGQGGSLIAWRFSKRLHAHDFIANAQYIVMESPLESYTPFWHPFRYEFHNFAIRQGYIFLHGAAAGIDGKGVLLSATGGSGKSTTILGCLLEGFDYVSDDYLIMDCETGEAYPVYSCGILNTDSLERLPGLKEHISGWVPGKDNRAIIDLSTYGKQFIRGMKIKALIRPQVPKNKCQLELAPRITQDYMQDGKMQMAISTARQNGYELLKKSDFVYQIMNCVKDLPSYELLLSANLQENTMVLRNFINNI